MSISLEEPFGTNDLTQATLVVVEATVVVKTSSKEAAAVAAGKFRLCASFSDFVCSRIVMGTERLHWMFAAKVNCVVDSGDHLDGFQKSASWSLDAVSS